MNRVYNDEDNAPMNEDTFSGYHNPTVYNSRDEMEYYESGRYEHDLEVRETAKEIRECQIRERFLDDLEYEGSCRECPWLIEGIIEQYEADEDGMLPAFCYNIAEGMCKVCMANPDRKDEAIEEYLKGVEEG